MRVLTINCGSSTLKFQLMEVCLTASAQERRLARGIVDRIGGRGEIELSPDNDERTVQPAEVPDHGEAALRAIRALDSSGLVGEVEAVGHRVVHGGTRFSEPTLLDNAAVVAIEELTELAPLHNGPALAAIRATREALGPGVPMVATFDTAFHRTMPEKAALYAIPPELAAKHGIRRYGFHGLAHRYMAERYAEIATTPLKQTKLVTLQLGNGCSAAAVDGGRSVDTSMGLTPLEGLVMGTRSGDVDPSLAGFLAHREGASVEEVEGWLNHRSGLLGVSGVSRDMREVLEAEGRGDERALLAVEMFVYRVRKQLGAYLAALGGADAVVFGGGIGEHAPEVRSRILAGMAWCGLEVDEETNEETVGTEARISAESSRIHAHVIPVDEEKIIARDTVRCLRETGEHRGEGRSEARRSER
jgi:acetate kinase